MLNFGLIGLGYWGPHYLRLLTQSQGVNTIIACDRSEEAIRRCSLNHPNVVFVPSIDALLKQNVQAVVIATHATSHFDLAQRCLESGIHVLVEKPLTTDPDAAIKLQQAAAKSGSVLMVAHTFIYHDAVQRLKEIVRNGDIGTPQYVVSIRASLGPIRHDVNAVWDLMVHDLCILDYLYEGVEPDRISHLTASGLCSIQSHIHDVVTATLTIDGRLFCSLHASWLAPIKTRQFQVIGTKGAVVFDDTAVTDKLTVYERLELDHHSIKTFEDFISASKRAGRTVVHPVQVREPMRVQFDHFLECIRRGTTPRSDAASGWRIVHLAHRINSAMLGGKS